MKIKILLLLGLLVSTDSIAHSGRTNAKGCHVEKSTNIEHCHDMDNEQTAKSADVETVIEQNKQDLPPDDIPPEYDTAASKNKTDSSDSDSKPSKMLLAIYIFLTLIIICAVVVIVAFNDLRKNMMKRFNALVASIFLYHRDK